MDITDTDYGTQPCNCARKFLVYGECTFGSNNSCRTTGEIYKICCCASETCKCFYISKFQQYVKKRIHEHIGDVSKLCSTYILPPHCTRRPPASSKSLQTASPIGSRGKSTSARSVAMTQNSLILSPTLPSTAHVAEW